MKRYGLVGYPLGHSFSKVFFEEKFSNENIKDVQYIHLESKNLADLIYSDQLKRFDGFNVTIPHKETIMPYLDELSHDAKAIGAVNCVKNVNGTLIGYNTDYVGFYNSIKALISTSHNRALILGNGGATKAIVYALKNNNINCKIVSRNSSFDYKHIDKKCIENHLIIVNCTPLGTYPKTETFPDIPYQFLSKKHILFDLVYNPKMSRFLSYGKEKNCTIKNGMEMLTIQAEQSWKIWNSENYTY